MNRGYTGISFPFRIGNRGGVVLSSTDRFEVPHIEESIEQILRTRLGERVMEFNVGSELDTYIFDPNDLATQNIIRYEIVDALTRQEPRIKVEEDDITFEQRDEKLFAKILFEVISYHKEFETTVEIGGEEFD